MKIYKQMILLIICLLPCMFLLSACKDKNNSVEPEVLSLNIELLNDDYALDTTGQSASIYGHIYSAYGSIVNLSSQDFKVTAIYNDNSSKTLSNTDYIFSTNIPSNTVTPTGSYELNFKYNDSICANVKVVITKQEVSTENISWNYSTSLTYNGKEQTISLQNIPNTLKVTYSGTNSAKIPGKYTVSATITPVDEQNYSAYKKFDLNWEIVKADLTITANNTKIIYGQSPQNNGCTYSGFAENENSANLSGELSYSFNYTTNGNVGNYKITPFGLTSDNYNILFIPGTLTVDKATVDTSMINASNIKLKQNLFEESNNTVEIELEPMTLPAGIKFTGLTGDISKQLAGDYTAIARYECSDTTNYENFDPVEISLPWSITAMSQPVPATSLPSDLEVSIQGTSISVGEFITLSEYYIAYFDMYDSGLCVSGDSCEIMLISNETFTAVDCNENHIALNTEAMIPFIFSDEIESNSCKIVINYQDTDFIIYIAFADCDLNL